ncbi:MAG TPA: protease, partial [Gemmata sp.]|nr:protease [Gemmata sp.]
MHRALLVVLLFPTLGHADDLPLLLQRPSVSDKHVAFAYAGDLWVVDRAGGYARRLTAGTGLENYPVFSPDGRLVAFAGEYEGNLDVYVVPASGGIPRRLTHHPDPDVPVGWTPDGKNIIFRSPRTSYARFLRLFSVSVEGGQPNELPLPQAEDCSLSPDGTRIAYVPLSNKPQFPGALRPLRNYRGGTASPIWIADLSDSSITKIPRTDSNDFNPMWVGENVYFLSDRDGPTTLFAYDTKSKEVRRVLEPGTSDIKSASPCSDAIVFDRFGTLNLFDLKTGKSQPVSVRIAADLPGVRPKMEKIAKHIQSAGLSPTGTRAVFQARGEILTVPAEKGDPRNLTSTTGAAERDPVWSPDGKSIAYFSDQSGEYELHIMPQTGRGEVRKFKLGNTPSFFYNPTWSPDSKKIAFADKRLNLWYIDLDTGKSTKVDTGPY